MSKRAGGREPAGHVSYKRALARGELDVCGLGRRPRVMVLVERVIRWIFGIRPGSAGGGAGTRILGTVITMSFVVVAWVFFRAESVDSAWYVLTHMFSGWARQGISCGLYATHLITSLGLIGVVLAYDVWEEWRVGHGERSLWDTLPTAVRWGGYWSLATCTLLLGQLSGTKQFIYFQF